MDDSRFRIPFSTPLAILVSGIVIALAIVYVGKAETKPLPADLPVEQPLTEVRSLTPGDHVLGSPEADIILVEYSDIECPFCAQIHNTLQSIVEQSGGKIAWVYRHFPLTSIHAHALPAALAAECVASLGGNEAFFSFVSLLFSAQRSLGDATYVEAAKAVGVEPEGFKACVTARTYEERVKTDFSEAIAAGGQGTPFVIIKGKDGKQTSFSGALPSEYITQIIASVSGR